MQMNVKLKVSNMKAYLTLKKTMMNLKIYQVKMKVMKVLPIIH